MTTGDNGLYASKIGDRFASRRLGITKLVVVVDGERQKRTEVGGEEKRKQAGSRRVERDGHASQQGERNGQVSQWGLDRMALEIRQHLPP